MEWYAGKIKIEEEYQDNLKTCYQIANRILDRTALTPDGVLAALQNMRGTRYVVNDQRVYPEWITPDEVAPLEWQRYMALDKNDCCIVSVVADSEDTAADMLPQEFLNMKYDAGVSKLRDWIARDEPIKIANGYGSDKRPSLDPPETRILSPYRQEE
jgi:hypothetical protein